MELITSLHFKNWPIFCCFDDDDDDFFCLLGFCLFACLAKKLRFVSWLLTLLRKSDIVINNPKQRDLP